jgi:hypothetical protein
MKDFNYYAPARSYDRYEVQAAGVKPDHFENYDDWPFLWGQNEGTIAGNTQYIIFGSSFKNIVGTNQ